MIKVMVVDDSALMRKLITQILEQDPGIKVTDTAMDGIFALEKIPVCKPDVVTLDVEMPRKDGMQTLKEIKKMYPEVQVVMLSSLTTEHAHITIKALELGAFDFIPKPSGKSIDITIKNSSHEIIEKVKNAYRNRGVSHSRVEHSPVKEEIKAEKSQAIAQNRSLTHIVAIGISTGGPNAILSVLPKLPADLKACILIVQHMPAGFTKAFADRLNTICQMTVSEAKDHEVCTDGRVFVAPGDYHLAVRRDGVNLVTAITHSEPVNRHRPSADVLFESVANNFGRRAMGVIMTGMGSDGAKNIGMIRRLGGYTIGQDERSSIVYGMPKVARELGNLDRVVELRNIYKEIIVFTK